MDESMYSSSSSASSRLSSSSSTPSKRSTGGSFVLSIQCLKGGSKASDWTGDMLQTGDIVEEITIGNTIVRSPFRNGKSAVQRILHASFKQKMTEIRVKVRRGEGEFAELQACIIPGEQLLGLGRKQYLLRAIDDPNYAVGLVDRTESECLNLQASRTIRMVSALERTPLNDGFVAYPWEQRLREMLPIPKSSSFFSVLFFPKSSQGMSSRYNNLEDTLARAHAWINASRESGVPVVFMSVQTESLLTKISGETASSTVSAGSLSDLSKLANTSLYGFEDYHGIDIGVVKAVRLWFSPLAGEIPIEIRILDTDTKLGFAISRTEEGFIYISSVIKGYHADMPSTRSGLSNLHQEASRASKLLVVSRISNQKVLPWMISPTGAIRCFDTVSLSQKLSLHRHSRVPVVMHVFLWDRSMNLSSMRMSSLASTVPTSLPSSSWTETFSDESVEIVNGNGSRESDRHDIMLERDTAGEFSFQSHAFSVKDKWV